MILTNSSAAKVGASNATTIASSTASFRQFMCYLSATISTAITGTTGLIKNGIGGLTLSGICNYTGTTQINQGTLTITSASSLSGVISGAGSLAKTGTAVLTIGGNNTYSGGTSFNSGGLATLINFNSSNAFGTGLFTVSNAAGQISTGGNVTLPNDFLINTSLQYRTVLANTITITGNIAGAGGINKTGNGPLNLTAATLTYTGSTSRSSGSIVASKTTGASTATATLGAGLSVSFNVAPPSGITTFRFFQGSFNLSYGAVTLVGVPVGTTATWVAATSTLTVIVP